MLQATDCHPGECQKNGKISLNIIILRSWNILLDQKDTYKPMGETEMGEENDKLILLQKNTQCQYKRILQNVWQMTNLMN